MANERRPLEKLAALLESRGVDKEVLQNLLALAFNPIDLAEFLESQDADTQLEALYLLDPPLAAQVLTAMGSEARKNLVEQFGDEKLSDVIQSLPSHAGADLIHLLSKDKEQSVLDRLEVGKRERVRRLLQYAPETAGGRMTTNFVAVPEEFTAGETMTALQGAVKAETVDSIYVVDDAQHLKGVCSLRELLTALPDTAVVQLMKRDPISVLPEVDQEHVAHLARRYNMRAVPVTSPDHVFLGVVTLNNVLDVVHQEAEEDILKLAGVTGSYDSLKTIRARVIARLPWLGVTLVGELILAYCMQFFETTIAQNWFLALFFPVNNAIAGNHGLQSSTLVTRAVATGQIKASQFARLLLDEFAVGILVGLASGITTAFFAFFLEWHLAGHVDLAWKLSVVIAISMTLGLTIAAVSGIITPLVFHRMGKDPALAAGPFISALNDMICTLIYLLTAMLFLVK